MGGAQLLWPEQHDGDHDQVGEQAHNNWGEGPVGLDWIGFTIGYWCCHRSKDCSMNIKLELQLNIFAKIA